MRWLLAVLTDVVDPSRETEFNVWYNEIHLPDIMQMPGFIRATRYENADPDAGPGKFLAAYEIESEDIEKTLAELRRRVAKLKKQGRISDSLVDVSWTMYRQIGSLCS
jgi:hypothetical protein